MLRKPHWPPAAWSEGRAGLKGQHPPEDVPGSCLRTTAIISCPHCVSVPGWQSKPPTLFPSLSPDVWAAGLGAGMARRNPSGRGHKDRWQPQPAFPPQGWVPTLCWRHLGAGFGQMSSMGQESEIKHSDLAKEAAKAARAIGH